MSFYLQKKKKNQFYRVLSCLMVGVFTLNVIFPSSLCAQVIPGMIPFSAPGGLLSSGPAFVPALIKGIRIHSDNPLEFDFIIDTGDSGLRDKALAEESTRMVKYFLAALTVPEDELWVNLSPAEADRVIPDSFGATDMGMDLLAQDYILKQLTASLIYPEQELGKKFWDRVYAQAREKFGTTDIALDHFNKVWIVPEQAAVYEHGEYVFVMNSHLRVMLEQDYLAKRDNQLRVTSNASLTELQTEIMSEIVIPALEKEVNEGSHFVKLRQINQAAILAKWYKQALRESLLGKVYVDQNKTKGIDTNQPELKEDIYAQYLEAFREGVYDYIREEHDPQTDEVIPRRYFSGGAGLKQKVRIFRDATGAAFDSAMLGSDVISIQDERDLPRSQRIALRRAVSPLGDVVRMTFALAENLLETRPAGTDSSMLSVSNHEKRLLGYFPSGKYDPAFFKDVMAASRLLADLERLVADQHGVLYDYQVVAGLLSFAQDAFVVSNNSFRVKDARAKISIKAYLGILEKLRILINSDRIAASVLSQYDQQTLIKRIDSLRIQTASRSWGGISGPLEYFLAALLNQRLRAVGINARRTEDPLSDAILRAKREVLIDSIFEVLGLHEYEARILNSAADMDQIVTFASHVLEQHFKIPGLRARWNNLWSLLREKNLNGIFQTRLDLIGQKEKDLETIFRRILTRARERDIHLDGEREEIGRMLFHAGDEAAPAIARAYRELIAFAVPYADEYGQGDVFKLADHAMLAQPLTVKEDFSRGNLHTVSFTDGSELRIDRDTIGGRPFTWFSYFDNNGQPVYRMTKDGDHLGMDWQEALNEMAVATAQDLGDTAMLSSADIFDYIGLSETESDPEVGLSKRRRDMLIYLVTQVIPISQDDQERLGFATIDQVFSFFHIWVQEDAGVPVQLAAFEELKARFSDETWKNEQGRFFDGLERARKAVEAFQREEDNAVRIVNERPFERHPNDAGVVREYLQAARQKAGEVVSAYQALNRQLQEFLEPASFAKPGDHAMLALDKSLTVLDKALTDKAKQVEIDYQRLASGFAGYTQPDQVAKVLTQILGRLNAVVSAFEEVSSSLWSVETLTRQQKERLERLTQGVNKFLDDAWQIRWRAADKTRAAVIRNPMARKAHWDADRIFRRGHAASERIAVILSSKRLGEDQAMLSQEQQRLAELFKDGTFDYQFFMKHGGAEAGDKLAALLLRNKRVENAGIVTGLLALFLDELFVFQSDFADTDGVSVQEYLALMNIFTQLWARELISDDMVAQFVQLEELRTNVSDQIQRMAGEASFERDVLAAFAQQLEFYAQRERLQQNLSETVRTAMGQMDVVIEDITAFLNTKNDAMFKDLTWGTRLDGMLEILQGVPFDGRSLNERERREILNRVAALDAAFEKAQDHIREIQRSFPGNHMAAALFRATIEDIQEELVILEGQFSGMRDDSAMLAYAAKAAVSGLLAAALNAQAVAVEFLANEQPVPESEAISRENILYFVVPGALFALIFLRRVVTDRPVFLSLEISRRIDVISAVNASSFSAVSHRQSIKVNQALEDLINMPMEGPAAKIMLKLWRTGGLRDALDHWRSGTLLTYKDPALAPAIRKNAKVLSDKLNRLARESIGIPGFDQEDTAMLVVLDQEIAKLERTLSSQKWKEERAKRYYRSIPIVLKDFQRAKNLWDAHTKRIGRIEKRLEQLHARKKELQGIAAPLDQDTAMLTRQEMAAGISDLKFQKEFLGLLGKRTAFAMLKLDHLGPNGKAIIAIMVKALEKDFQIFFGPQLHLSRSQLDGFDGARKEKDFLSTQVVRYHSGHAVLPLFLLARKGVENPFAKLADARKVIESRLKISDPARNPLHVSADPASAALETKFMFEMFKVEELDDDNILALIREGEKDKEKARAKEEDLVGEEGDDVLADEFDGELKLAEEKAEDPNDSAMLAKTDSDFAQELRRLFNNSGVTYYDYWELLKRHNFGVRLGDRPINGRRDILNYLKRQDPNSVVYLSNGESRPIQEAMTLVEEHSRLRICLLSEWAPASLLVLERNPLARAQAVLEDKNLSGLVEQAIAKLRGTHYDNRRMMDMVVWFLNRDFFMEFQDFVDGPVQDELRAGIRPEGIVFSDSDTDYLMLDAASMFPELIATLAQMDEGIAREFLDDIVQGKRGAYEGKDFAMLTGRQHVSVNAQDVGGIDLNPALYDLQIRRDGNGVPLPLPDQPFETMHIEGFTPILIEMSPVTNLPMLLGLADESEDRIGDSALFLTPPILHYIRKRALSPILS